MSPKRNKGSALEDAALKGVGKQKNQDKTLKFGAYLMFESDMQSSRN
jgi:hypothetical protein